MAKLPISFYQNEDVLEVAKSLLGKELVVNNKGCLFKSTIVETEAYNGIVDKASHAYGGKYTTRTKVMYNAGGVAYVYLCYGIHNLFNVVTGKAGHPQAVLIRAVEPKEEVQQMLKFRKLERFSPRVTAGPGALTQALQLTRNDNGISLISDRIWINNSPDVSESSIVSDVRIGVAYAAEDALLPYRFYIKGNAFVSKPNK